MSGLELHGIETLYFGVDSVNRIGESVLAYGKRVLLITEYQGSDQTNAKHLLAILKNAGIDPVLFDDIRPGVQIATLESIADIGRAAKIQLVIGLGGMRVLALARIATIMIGSNSDLADIFKGNLPHSLSCCHIEIPSSCRNHFMMQNACIIADSVNNCARFIELPARLTKAVFIDPQLSMNLSEKYQTVAIIDTLTASVEGYLSMKRNFMSDMYLIEAIHQLHKALFHPRSDEVLNRVMASEGGLCSSMGLATSSQGIGGTLSYIINAVYQVPKSWIAMVLLPHILDMYHEDAKNHARLGRIAEALGEDSSGLQTEEAASHAAIAVRRFLARLELPSRLCDFNLSLEELYGLCDAAAQFPLNAFCGLELDSNAIGELVKRAF